MKGILDASTDARQSREWSEFLSAIGWEIIIIDGVYIFLRKAPFLNATFIKIQHPKGPLPFAKIAKLANDRRALFTVIEPHPQGYIEESYRKHGYTVSKMRYAHSATILIDLRKSTDELWNSFSENARRNIRKAEKRIRLKSISLEGKNKDQIIGEFYTLYSRLGKQKKFYVPPISEVHAKMNAFAKTSVVFRAFEGDSQDPVAELWVGSVEQTLVYFHPGNTERGYELLANYLLVWEAMKWGKQQGLKVFDFETAYDMRYPGENKRWKGYTEFKKRFGGDFVEYPPSYIKFSHPVIKGIYLFGTMFSK